MIVFGATGPTGRCVVELAQQRGYDITAFVRSPSTAGMPSSVELAEGDAFDKAAVSRAILNQDVVIVVLGPPSVGFTKVGSEGTKNIVEAMQEAGAKRLIVQTGHGVGDSFRRCGPLQQLMYKTFLRQNYSDKRIQEDVVRRSDLDWTVVRPTILTNAKPRSSIKADEALRTWLLPSVPRANVAKFILDAVDDRATVGKGVSVT